MDKVASGALSYCQGSLMGDVLDIIKEAEENFTRAERRALRRTARGLQKRTPKEVEELAGRGFTGGQIARRVGIGAGFVAGAGLGRRLITRPELLRQGWQGVKKTLSPRELAADVLTGATFYGMAPGVIRHADIEAAKRGKY